MKHMPSSAFKFYYFGTALKTSARSPGFVSGFAFICVASKKNAAGVLSKLYKHLISSGFSSHGSVLGYKFLALLNLYLHLRSEKYSDFGQRHTRGIVLQL